MAIASTQHHRLWSSRLLTVSALLAVGTPPTPRVATVLAILSFVLPILAWCAVSYVPFIWHPLVEVTDAGSSYLNVGMVAPKDVFADEVSAMQAAGKKPPEGRPANPIYLPPPHEVLHTLWRAVVPFGAEGKSLLIAFGHSVQIIVCAFLISWLIGVPLGILCGAYPSLSRLTEPFVEFFRYLPAPAFVGVDLPDRCRTRRHLVGHHILHRPAGPVPTLRQRLCRDPGAWHRWPR
jgi:NitT/TauT family transport system permease protein